MTAWISKQTGNWTRTSDNADSPWYDGGAQSALSSYPGGAGTGDSAQIGDGVTATQIITLDANPTYSLATITNGDNTSYVACATDRAVTLTGENGVNYSGTNTSGLIRVTANTLTLTGAGAGTSTVTGSGSGRVIFTSGSGAIVISNSGGTAITASGSGVAVNITTGTNTITGAVLATATGVGVRIGGGTTTITGDVIASGDGSTGVSGFSGTCILDGMASGKGWALYSSNSSTINWTGTRTLAASENCMLYVGPTTATLNLATAVAALTVTNSGSFCVHSTGGTLVMTDSGNTVAINCQNATSYATIIGGTDAQKGYISYPAGGGGGTRLLLIKR